MRVLLGIVFWTLATLEGVWLLFMLFMALAAGPRMAENGDVATPLFWNVLLPLIALIGAILLFARTRSPVTRGIALLSSSWRRSCGSSPGRRGKRSTRRSKLPQPPATAAKSSRGFSAMPEPGYVVDSDQYAIIGMH